MHTNNGQFRREKIGMPDSHADKFKEIADTLNVVICSRAVGPTALQLLEQGYDTKGFRIHAKSCDWGPMAGFVLMDPRLNKAGMKKSKFNLDELRTSLNDSSHSGWRASGTPLKIYPGRLKYLMDKDMIHIQRMDANGPMDRFEGQAVHSTGIRFYYTLHREVSNDGFVWGVYFDTEMNGRLTGFRQIDIRPAFPKLFGRFDPMLAMTNPTGHRSWPSGDFRNAVTGDYDLFAIWPRVTEYDPRGRDRRILGTAHVITHAAAIDHRERYFTAEGQGTKLGNMTDRVYEVCQFLNSAIASSSIVVGSKTYGPFAKRMVCWHSDESARPGVQDVDLPFIAFGPSRNEFGIETITDFRELIRLASRKFKVTLAEGWTRAPDAAHANRLGAHADLVPRFEDTDEWQVPGWYNE